MIVEHRGRTPRIDPTATIAPGAIVSGDVVIAAGVRILHGAVLTAEDGEVRVGRETVVLEHALIRGRTGRPAIVGEHVMVGPHSHVNGATVGDRAFIATGATLLPGSIVGEGAEVRVNGVVHANTTLEPGAIVPIGWVAVGTPASLFSPDRHDEIQAIQQTLDFPGTTYGVDRSTGMDELMLRQSRFYAAHDDDRVVD